MARQSLVLVSLLFLFLTGCASSTFKARQEQREKMAANSGMYCQFVSGDLHPDLDVELSMQMGQRCDSSKNFTITNSRNSSGQNGVIFCCATAPKPEKKSAAAESTKQTAEPAKSAADAAEKK